jgi:hypothetical protein
MRREDAICRDGVDDRPKGGMAWAVNGPWSCEKSRSGRLSLVEGDGWETWIKSAYTSLLRPTFRGRKSCWPQPSVSSRFERDLLKCTGSPRVGSSPDSASAGRLQGDVQTRPGASKSCVEICR